MKPSSLIFALIFSTALVAVGCTKDTPPPEGISIDKPHEDPDGYWTCSMHPQVHRHEKGKCPICGMELIHVDAKIKESKEPDIPQPEAQTQVGDKQLSLTGVGRYQVSRKDLSVSIPVAGNLISSGEVAFRVYESDLALVKVGGDFSGSASASPGEVLSGKIKGIDTLVDPASRTVKVIGALQSPSQKILIDGGFHGVIVSHLSDQLTIPQEAVLHAGRRDLVYLLSPDNRITPKKVVLGAKGAEEYAVLEGLHEGDVISTGPNFLLDSESKIRGGND